MTTNKPDQTTQPVWIFSFALEHESANPVSRATAESLMQSIIKWAEERNLQVGGGYRPPKPKELESGPIFVVKDCEE